MTPYFSDAWLDIYQGDVRTVLPSLPSDSVDCIVTSPPYWGLRDYGSDGQLGLERTPEEYVANMVAVFRELRRVLKPSGTCWLNLGSSFMNGGAGGSGPSRFPSPERAPAYGSDGTGRAGSPDLGSAYSDLCDGCLADWQTHLRHNAGNDQPPSESELPPSLIDRGSEPRDSEPASPDASPRGAQESTTLRSWQRQRGPCSRCDSRASYLSGLRSSSGDAPASGHNSWLKYTRTLKAKDLVPIPWMVAMALQEDGWYLRRDVIWNKPNPMPESVTDRPTSSHEYLFLLTKAARYYYDADAVREAVSMASDFSPRGAVEEVGQLNPSGLKRQSARLGNGSVGDPTGRNLRSVWTISTRPYPGAHFAVFPPELPERCIKAGSSERGVCPGCGAPWERVVRLTTADGRTVDKPASQRHAEVDGKPLVGDNRFDIGVRASWNSGHVLPERQTSGWQASCSCDEKDWAQANPALGTYLQLDPQPAVVLDPFAGSGTTGMVANRLSRRAILIDLNGDYLKQQLQRNAQTPLGLAG